MHISKFKKRTIFRENNTALGITFFLLFNFFFTAFSQNDPIIISPNPAYIGTIPVSSSESTTFVLSNVSNGTIKISEMSITGTNFSDYSLPGISYPVTIGPYSDFFFDLIYTPSVAGFNENILKIESSAGSFSVNISSAGTLINNNQVNFERILGIQSNSRDETKFAQTVNGNFVIAGSTILHSPDYNYITFDVYLLKTDPLGKLLWYRAFEYDTNGGEEIVDGGADHAFDILSLDDESIIVLGTTTAGGPGAQSVYLSKWSGEGDFLWEKTYGGKYDDIPYRIIQDADGNYIIAGSTNNTPDDSQNIMVMKIAPDGTLLWNKNYGTSGIENGFDIVEAHEGGYLIVGNFQNPVANIYFLKIDKDGNNQWNKTLVDSKTSEGSSIIKTNDGGYAISGYIFTDDMGMQGYLVKVNASADIQWSKSFGEENIDYFLSVAETDDEGLLCTGANNRFWSILYSYDDIWLLKTDNAGNLVWEKKYGGDKTQSGSDVVNLKNGGYAVVGTTESYREKERIFLMGLNGEGNILHIEELNKIIPADSDFFLSQNYPNPFKQNTTIVFSIPKTADHEVSLKVYNSCGNEIAELNDSELIDGKYFVNFNASGLENGVYFYRLIYGSNAITRKMILIK